MVVLKLSEEQIEKLRRLTGMDLEVDEYGEVDEDDLLYAIQLLIDNA